MVQHSTHSGRMTHFTTPEAKLTSSTGKLRSGVASSSPGSGSAKSVLVSDAETRTESSVRSFILRNNASTDAHSPAISWPRSFNSCSRSKMRRLLMEVQVTIEELREEKSPRKPRLSKNRWSVLVASSAPDKSCLMSSRTCGRATKNATNDCLKLISSGRVEGEPSVDRVSRSCRSSDTGELTQPSG